jgi:MFS family permease
MREILKARLSPFRQRDFRNFFLAQTLSLVGTWSHDMARSWIIVAATGSSGALGNLYLAVALPCLFLILQGGVIVDRADVRRLILVTKCLLGVSSLVLAALAEFSHVQVWQLLIFGLIEGVIVSFDSPAYQALNVRMVPREDLQQAIALNSTNFHTSRMLGPLVAAWLMAWHGSSLVFLFDGLTYFLVAAVLLNVRLMRLPRNPGVAQARSGLRAGLSYIWSTPRLRYGLLQLALTIGCINPIMYTVFRVYVQRTFHLDESQFGTVFSFPAMGSMAGALSFAVFKPRQPRRTLYFGMPLVFALLLIFPWLPTLNLAVLVMTLTGFGLYLSFASLTVSMQLEVQEEFRGRLSAMIGLGFSALGPLMCFPWGHLADLFGADKTLTTCALVFGAGSVVLWRAAARGESGPPSKSRLQALTLKSEVKQTIIEI